MDPASLRSAPRALEAIIPGVPTPVAVWSFDDCSYESDSIHDELSDSPGSWSGGSACAYRSPSGSAGRFTGSNHVEAPDRPELRFPAAVGISVMVKPTRLEGSNPIVHRASSPGAALIGTMLSIENGQYVFTLLLQDGAKPQVSAPATLGEWTHLAGSYNGQSLALFINGRLVSQVSAVGTPWNSTGEVSIGRHVWSGHFQGLIDDVRLFNRGLNPLHVRRLASALFGLPQAVGLWDFDDCSDTSPVLLDTAVNATPAHAEKLNSVTCSTGQYGSSVAFSGTGLVRVPHQPQHVLFESVSIAASVRPLRIDVPQAIVNKVSDSLNTYALVLVNGSYRFSLRLANGSSLALSTPATVDVFAHLTGTFDGSMMRLYLNGRLMAWQEVMPTTLHPSTAWLRIGNNSSGDAPFQGRIDDVRLFNVALSPEQVRVLSLLIKNRHPACITPTPGTTLDITGYTRLCAGTYDVIATATRPAVRITTDEVTLECEGTVFRTSSVMAATVGIRIESARNVTVRGCGATGFMHGLQASAAVGLLVEEVMLDDNFTDRSPVWEPSRQGGGILFDSTTDSMVNASSFNANWNGIELRSSHRNRIMGNVGHSCSNMGALLVDSRDNTVARNDLHAAFRGDPTWPEGGRTFDSTGIRLLGASHGNRLLSNDVSSSGDGIALLNGADCPRDNLILGNTASFCARSGIWSTCDGNRFEGNDASDNRYYGMRLGGTDGAVVRGNTLRRNGADGISLHLFESRHMILERNVISDSGRVGVMVSGRDMLSLDPPGSCNPQTLSNASHILIQSNTFSNNGTDPSRCTGQCDVALEAVHGVMLASNCTEGALEVLPRFSCDVEAVWQVGACGTTSPSPPPPVTIQGDSTVQVGVPVTFSVAPTNLPAGARFHWLVQRGGERFVSSEPPVPVFAGEHAGSLTVTFPSPGPYDVDVFLDDSRSASLGHLQVEVVDAAN